MGVFSTFKNIYNFVQSKHKTKATEVKAGGEMVACKFCNLYVPKSQAYALGDKLFCSKEHATAWQQEN